LKTKRKKLAENCAGWSDFDHPRFAAVRDLPVPCPAAIFCPTISGKNNRTGFMKTLHLLRHAKSAWDQPGLSDRERGLNKRGRRDAPRMGAALAARLAPMPLTVSPARRARLTLEGLCAGWPGLADFAHVTEDELYTFSAADVRKWLAQRDEQQDRVFIIGHNPALTDLANGLAAGGGLANLPTAGYLELTLQIDRWRDLRQGCALIEYSLFPRQL
jgi:phosphohistidine phosphatase